MKKMLAVVTATIICFGLVGCSNNKEFDTRFAYVYKGSGYSIVADKETGVMYIIRINEYSGGITVMLDADGKPLIYEGEYEGGADNG
jgi:uncharacterized lipoprotein NlpE involved in copper resistance